MKGRGHERKGGRHDETEETEAVAISSWRRTTRYVLRLWPHLRVAQLGEVLGDPGEGAMIHLELSGLESPCGPVRPTCASRRADAAGAGRDGDEPIRDGAVRVLLPGSGGC